MAEKLGISGRIARSFLTSEITPLLALVGFLLGVFAVMITPREEEPQINVTFANVFIAYPGASAQEVEELVSTPAEQILSELEGVKHIYSVSYPGMSVLTVQFKVGEDRTRSIVRLYNAMYSKSDWLPSNLGVLPPIIKPKGIDDVPIVSLTLWSKNKNKGAEELQKVAHAIEVELKRVPGTRDIYTIGGPDNVVHVLFKPSALAGYGLSLENLRNALQLSNATRPLGDLVKNNREIEVQAGQFLSTPEQVSDLIVGVHAGKPVYLHDVATVRLGPDQPEQYVWFSTGPAAASKHIPGHGEYPAVTIAIAKQPGSNAVQIADNIIQRVDHLKGVFIPHDVNVTVTRNYGETANAKALKLIEKLIFATASVVLLVLFALGRREAVIVGVAVVITLAITLFASWVWGFTLNRVSLFALIFSIGILVDDAIVVVENIHRHIQLGARDLREAIPRAVDEVGGPTILATFTVIAALLPMAFVTGLMGPYMSPIPINASTGMLISLVVAFAVTPWLANKLISVHGHHTPQAATEGKLYRIFVRYVGPFLQGEQGRKRRWILAGVIGLAILISVSLALPFKVVIMKMLPFDNKSELQVVVDMPAGTPLQQTSRVLHALGGYLDTVPEVTDYEAYAGTASPINFNGLVRQYYLRKSPNMGDIQVNLTDKHERERKSHEIALALRPQLDAIAEKYHANIKIVEVPPGPPVLSPLVAEVYGLNYNGQLALAKRVRKAFESTPDIVDVDDSVIASAPKLIVQVDQHKAALWGVSQQSIVSAIHTALDGEDISYLHPGHLKYPLPIRLELPANQKRGIAELEDIHVPGANGKLIAMSDLVHVVRSEREQPIYHKDLLPVVYVTGDMAGKLDSPLYGMFDIAGKLARLNTPQGYPLAQHYIAQPQNPYLYSIKWDGEWQVTYETFRDMGIAYAVGLILIYFLVVAQFRSYFVPIIIMAPIPLTVMGVIPGHAFMDLFGEAQFTATSMIGMIALAGIIVRNSILLVDFINQQVAEGIPLQDAVLRAGAVRAKPIMLTGLAAMLGALFILDDPIFNGLAISLIFGILVSTLLTLVVIPVWYYAYRMKHPSPT
ncbi:MAG: efflux RND transporter permease subunit [Gammaproteobacteria bacterium]